ncbi:MAG: hypothetical protein LUH63_09535 [Parabacteroides sp.]|nr:hypothetical protein [Parabacteroides sp.]
MGQTWQVNHPSWEYMYWNKERMDTFVETYYPSYMDAYNKFPYDVMRWDVIRYMILYKIGGLYVDFDYECLHSLDDLLSHNSCYLGMESKEHAALWQKKYIVGNALMASTSFHLLIRELLETSFMQSIYDRRHKGQYVMNVTGPCMVTRVYNNFQDKSSASLLDSEIVSPFTQNEVIDYMNGQANEEFLEKKLEKAYSVHYYYGTWLRNPF